MLSALLLAQTDQPTDRQTDQIESRSLASLRMLVFDDVNDFMNTTNEVANMDDSELAAFENANNYTSLARKSDQVYNDIDFESFATQEELIAFVKANSKYVSLSQDNGELMTEPILLGNTYRRIANENGLFAIKDTVYRVLREGFVSTTKSNIAALYDFDNKSPYSLDQDQNQKIMFHPFQSEVNTRNIWVGGPMVIARHDQTVDRDRIVIKIESVRTEIGDMPSYRVGVCSSPQKKVLGVWHATSRTIWYDYEFHATSNTIGPIDAKLSGQTSGNRHEYQFCEVSGASPNIDITKFYCWATTASVNNLKALISHGM